MSYFIPAYRLLITLAAVAILSVTASAQSFKVESFRMLDNDVTSFVDPVKDLNDEGCALIKVEGSPDFVFSTPLGIVKRIDKVGETWIYLPKGSKKITIKHPQWGVMRDYAFPEKLRSLVSYELRLAGPERVNLPGQEMAQQITTVHDTLVVVRTDTLRMAAPVKIFPLCLSAGVTFAFGGRSKTGMGGVMLSLMKRHGAFVHLQSDLGKIGKTVGECDRQGYVDSRLPYYAGNTRHSAFIATAGAIHSVSERFRIFEGAGYGSDMAAWELAQSSGGGYIRNSHYSKRGVAFEVGTVYTLRNFTISVSAITIAGTQWYASVGIGYRFKAKQK